METLLRSWMTPYWLIIVLIYRFVSKMFYLIGEFVGRMGGVQYCTVRSDLILG